MFCNGSSAIIPCSDEASFYFYTMMPPRVKTRIVLHIEQHKQHLLYVIDSHGSKCTMKVQCRRHKIHVYQV